MAFFSTDVFLRMNGYKLKVEVHQVERLLIGLLEKNLCTFYGLLPWMRAIAVKM